MEQPIEQGSGERGPGLTPAAAFRADRMIALALPVGVLTFWGVRLALRGGREPAPIFGLDPLLATNATLALLLLGVIVAFVLRGRALSGLGDSGTGGPMPDAARLMALRSRLIVAWALLEAPALLAGAVHFMSGVERVLMYAAPVYLVGVALTFPRAEWYGADGRPA